jgi:putative flavoprotein involved in K+ transport
LNEQVETVVIGGGQSGLAMSYLLTQSGHEHLVLERGRVAERWRTERWDSLTLLTPNWMTCLPGYQYEGPAPDGFMARDEVVALFDGYAASFRPPIRSASAVRRCGRLTAPTAISSSPRPAR